MRTKRLSFTHNLVLYLEPLFVLDSIDPFSILNMYTSQGRHASLPGFSGLRLVKYGKAKAYKLLSPFVSSLYRAPRREITHHLFSQFPTYIDHQNFWQTVIMHFLTLLSIAFHLRLVQACTLYRYVQGTIGGIEKNYDCMAKKDPELIAHCLLHINSLETILGCTDVNPTDALWFLTADDSHLDGLDMIPLDDQFSHYHIKHDDGKFKFTPRALLVEVAESCPGCAYDLGDLFKQCPYDDLQQFLNCLCCSFLEPEDIEDLENFIESGGFGDAVLRISNRPTDFTCCLYCQSSLGSGLRCPEDNPLVCSIIISLQDAPKAYHFIFQ